MIDTRTPSGLADSLAKLTEAAAADAFTRYPNDRLERLADEAAQLRTILELAGDALRAMEEKP